MPVSKSGCEGHKLQGLQSSSPPPETYSELVTPHYVLQLGHRDHNFYWHKEPVSMTVITPTTIIIKNMGNYVLWLWQRN